MGVRRAVETARTELENGRPVYSLGPLIHNPQALAPLEKLGLVVLEETARPPAGASVIVRAHGIGPAVRKALQGRIADATCPRVNSSQNTARLLVRRGSRVFFAGERNHAETRGIAGYVEAEGGLCIIVGNATEAEKAAAALFHSEPGAKTALIAQTTFSADEFVLTASAIRFFFPGLEVKDTICGATRERQDALRELCAVVDAVLVAGGKGSANTRRLLDIARSLGRPAWLAESRADAAVLAGKLHRFRTLGLCAGASTPDGVIDEIEAELVKEN
jgi:4-hydroxy-3-methylbut-2-enyl diphosphate reductase